MMEGVDGRFVVEIHGPDGKVISQSTEGLGIKRALEFVEAAVDRERFSTHFHWEGVGTAFPPQNATAEFADAGRIQRGNPVRTA
jgi:hypothetical protein